MKPDIFPLESFYSQILTIFLLNWTITPIRLCLFHCRQSTAGKDVIITVSLTEGICLKKLIKDQWDVIYVPDLRVWVCIFFFFFFFFWLKTVADQYLLRVPVTDTVFICPLVAEPLVHCQCSGTFCGCCGQEQHSEDTANQKAYRVMNWVSPWRVARYSELHGDIFLNVLSVPLAHKRRG